MLAHLDLRGLEEQVEQRLERFHHEVAEQLMVHLLNRSTVAEEGTGGVTYMLGTRAQSFPLPNHVEANLGYPNSW